MVKDDYEISILEQIEAVGIENKRDFTNMIYNEADEIEEDDDFYSKFTKNNELDKFILHSYLVGIKNLKSNSYSNGFYSEITLNDKYIKTKNDQKENTILYKDIKRINLSLIDIDLKDQNYYRLDITIKADRNYQIIASTDDIPALRDMFKHLKKRLSMANIKCEIEDIEDIVQKYNALIRK